MFASRGGEPVLVVALLGFKFLNRVSQVGTLPGPGPPGPGPRFIATGPPEANSRGFDVSEMSARVGKATAHCEK